MAVASLGGGAGLVGRGANPEIGAAGLAGGPVAGGGGGLEAGAATWIEVAGGGGAAPGGTPGAEREGRFDSVTGGGLAGAELLRRGGLGISTGVSSGGGEGKSVEDSVDISSL